MIRQMKTMVYLTLRIIVIMYLGKYPLDNFNQKIQDFLMILHLENYLTWQKYIGYLNIFPKFSFILEF